MAFYMAQHGATLSKKEDPQKGLSPQGRLDVERIAGVAAGYNVPVSKICHSGKKRAAQTAKIFGDLFQPVAGIHTIEGINPLDDVRQFADRLDIATNKMIVGHLPYLERLIAYLITGQADQPLLQLQNGGMVCLDHYGESRNVVIKWAIMPKIP